VRLLASRAHSARELRIKLARRGHPADEVGEALDRLRAGGYLDDAAYARALIGRRSSSRGGRAMAAELAAKGVDREVAQAALGEIEGADQIAAAVNVARRMQRAGPTDLQRIGTRLLRRGFSMEVARAALRQL
jgi:regulatory protein